MIRAWRPGRIRVRPGFAAEDVDQHLDLELIFGELDDLAAEVGEGTFFDSYRFAHFVELAGAGLLLASCGCGVFIALDLQERLDFAAWQRRWFGALTHESGYAGRIADHEPGVIVEAAAHQQVAGEHLLLNDDLLALAELDDVFHWNDDFVDAAIHVHAGGTSFEVLLNLLLVTGLGVHHKPLARAVIRADDLGCDRRLRRPRQLLRAFRRPARLRR